MCPGVPSGKDLEEKQSFAYCSSGNEPSTVQNIRQSGHGRQMACDEKHGLGLSFDSTVGSP